MKMSKLKRRLRGLWLSNKRDEWFKLKYTHLACKGSYEDFITRFSTDSRVLKDILIWDVRKQTGYKHLYGFCVYTHLPFLEISNSELEKITRRSNTVDFRFLQPKKINGSYNHIVLKNQNIKCVYSYIKDTHTLNIEGRIYGLEKDLGLNLDVDGDLVNVYKDIEDNLIAIRYPINTLGSNSMVKVNLVKLFKNIK